MTGFHSEREEASPPRWVTAAAILWVLFISCLFVSQTLPNNPSVTRMMVVESLLDAVLGTQPAVPEAIPSGPQFLAQRLPLIGYAAVILLAAALQGGALLRLPWLSFATFATERVVIQLGLGLASFSLVVLFAGQLAVLHPAALLAPAGLASAVLIVLHFRTERPAQTVATTRNPLSPTTRVLDGLMWLVIIGTTLWLLLGAISPPTDFDVREYHLQGPKEWFQSGRIHFLAHNVYTSFPFLTEMFSLAGMVVTGEWWRGALVGKLVLASFAPLTALSVYCIARRLAGHHIGLLAAMIHVTTPWTTRISIIAYAEGALSFYLCATVMCLVIWCASCEKEHRLRLAWVTGLLAGSAMACKYTGLVSAVMPAGLMMVFWSTVKLDRPAKGERLDRWRWLLSFAVAVFVVICPWLIRNTLDTGNPVYPLAWNVFGGADWDAAVNERWRRAHSPDEHSLSRLPQHFLDVAIRNDWSSPLLFALAIPALLLWRRVPLLPLLAVFAGWQFLTWWALTHRIDRFWVPAIPLVAVLAAACRRLSDSQGWRWCFITAVALGTAFNLRFIALPIVGYHAGLQDLNAARNLVVRSDIRQLNVTLPDSARVLMVGEAEVFDCRFSVIYNTVFDESIFEQLTADPSDITAPPRHHAMKPSKQIRLALQQSGITHVLVNWSEILRYRSPGSYGYAEFVQPSRFQALVDAGILGDPVVLLSRPWSDMTEQDQQVVRSWDGSDRIHDQQRLQSVQLFDVRP